MKQDVRTISREIYDRAMANNGHLASEDFCKVYSVAELCGYGVYGPQVFKEDGVFYCRCDMGTSCD